MATTLAVPPDDEILVCGDLVVDLAAHQVLVDGEPIAFPHLQFQVVALFVRRAGSLVTYRELGTTLWGRSTGTVRNVQTAVSRVRDRLGVGPRRPRLVVRRRLGYVLLPPTLD